MITSWGILISLVFVLSYLGQSIASGMEGQKARWLQWACWLLASGAMLLCYLFTGTQGG